ncbi:EF-hand domain-containing protein [Sphingomonas sp.]|uniref:EF-hand domain-containing protein n=1 Tax=Sphingomonas sp. TaxID=28214 RepID=UPI00286C6381|nr:EF-hand domain-containing protein [Sphingomonas sp.]
MIIRTVISAAMLAVSLGSAATAQGNDNVPRATYITTMDQEFGKMDADKNGKVTRAEIEVFDRALALANARARAQATFTQLDVDKNGQISPTEFMKLVTGTAPADGRPLIAKLDGNKDGTISLIEHRGGKLGYFDQIDTDKDGVVTVAEMKAAGVVR